MTSKERIWRLGKPRMTSKVDGFGYNDILNPLGRQDLADELMKQIPLTAIPTASEDNGNCRLVLKRLWVVVLLSTDSSRVTTFGILQGV